MIFKTDVGQAYTHFGLEGIEAQFSEYFLGELLKRRGLFAWEPRPAKAAMIAPVLVP